MPNRITSYNVCYTKLLRIALDIALGTGGLPRGRIIEVYGPESSGKTTVALHAIAEVQKVGGQAAFIDAEHALDPSYASKLGVNIDELLLSQPDTGEQALEIAEALVRSGAVDIIVIDSVAALVPKAEIEGEMGVITSYSIHYTKLYEIMQHVLTNESPIYSRMLKFAGIGESALETKLLDLIESQTDPTIAPFV